MTDQPRFKLRDRVIIQGGSTVWEVVHVLPATRSQPIGYRLREVATGTATKLRLRTADQDRLYMAEQYSGADPGTPNPSLAEHALQNDMGHMALEDV